jgi:recombination protein RecR
MIRNLPSLERLVEQLRRLPYLASKNVYRVAAHFLTKDEAQVEQFCRTVLAARQNIKACSICFNWTEGLDKCSICSDVRRDSRLICVVETWHDLVSIERSGDFRGLYHVLGGALCPLEGIGPDKLAIKPLLLRVESGQVEEIIFATNPTPEGEATSSFIASKIEKTGMKMSRLASGIPMGSSLEYIDRMTIHKAISGRQPF